MGGVSSELPNSLVAINVNDIKKPQTLFFFEWNILCIMFEKFRRIQTNRKIINK